MKNTTILGKINNLIEKMDYKTAYIEIQTDKEKYTLEQEKKSNRI